MNYGLISKPSLTTSECLVIGFFGNVALPEIAKQINKQHNNLVNRVAEKLVECGDTAFQADVDNHSLLLIHCGDEAAFTAEQLSKRIAEATCVLLKQKVNSATICMPLLAQRTPDWQVQQMLLKFEDQCYQFLEFKRKKPQPHRLQTLHFCVPGATTNAVSTAEAIAEGIRFTRNLVNLPANVCTPTYLAEQAIALAQSHDKLQTKVLNRDEMQQMGMGALLAVAQGSQQPPQLVGIQYKGASDKMPPIVLVGKGITFDSGGISLKSPPGMNEMKYDMGGAASVLGTLKACALLKLPINVIGMLACAENMPSGSAVKPGDIVTSLSGQTIEIINTDAEGRLVLADTLTYIERFKPSIVIDIATLTGAVIIALGHVNSGFMTKDEELAEMIHTAARESEDKAWRLPLEDAYQEALDSPIADMINSSFDRSAGSVTAACFLSRFTEKYRWAHLDIAGTAWVSGKNNCATGRPVPLLVQLLRQIADAR